MERLITVIEVADRLRVSTREVNRLVRNSEIPHIVLPGNKVRFSPAEVDEWLSRRHS